MTLVIVWLLPVPGGPWTTSAPSPRANATARAWHGSAAAASHAGAVTGCAGTTVAGASALGGASKSMPAVRNARTGPADSSPIIARVSRISPWLATGNNPNTAAGTMLGPPPGSSSARGAGASVNANGGVTCFSPDFSPVAAASSGPSGRPLNGLDTSSAAATCAISPASSPHGSPSSSLSAGGTRPVCCSIHANRAALGRTRSPASPRPASSTAGVAPAFTASDTGTNATGAKMRFPSPSGGGTDSSGNPTASAATPVSFSYVRASSAITRSLASNADWSRYARSFAVSASSTLRGGFTRATTRAAASFPSSPCSTASGVASDSFAS